LELALAIILPLGVGIAFAAIRFNKGRSHRA
jgi:hypothetical protein